MKTLRDFYVLCLVSLFFAASVSAADPLPDYLSKAQYLIDQANVKASGMNEFSDAVLMGQNYLRRAESEYKKNLGWGNKLDQKAEPSVRYYADMAGLQASVVLSQLGKIDQEKEQARLAGLIKDVKAKLKVFDDQVANISALKGELVKRDAVIATTRAEGVDLKKQLDGKQQEIEQLNAKINALNADIAARVAVISAVEAKLVIATGEIKTRQQNIAGLEQKVSDLNKALDAAKSESIRLRTDLTALAAQKGAADSQNQEQIHALQRAQDFVTEVGKLGGVIKAGSDNMTVIFVRASMLKSPKNDTLTVDGDKALLRITELLKNYSEYRVKLKVHGFGQPAKNEDAAATDRMARLIREALLEKGKFEPTVVEALGAGSTEPIYPKNNPEGNRRVEVTFVKK